MVSIVIPNYNYALFIPDCLKSCMAQTFGNIEIIVIDDCSTDNSMAAIWNIAATDKRISVQQLPKNSGVSVARNTGLDVAKGEYVTFLDADDMLFPNAIQDRLFAMISNPSLDMVWGHAKKINEEKKNYGWSYEQCVDQWEALETYGRYLNAQTLLWKRNVFERFGGYCETLKSKEDKELLYRLGAHPKSPFDSKIKCKKIDSWIAIYRRHPQAKHKRRMADKAWCEQTERLFDKRMKLLRAEGITHENTRFPK